MLNTDTYLGADDGVIRFLEAFSSIDQSVYETLPLNVRVTETTRLIRRLAAVVSVHGDSAAGGFLRALIEAPAELALPIANSFLESGRGGAEADYENSASRELQQEIQHFSRIVDIEHAASDATPTRLKNSARISDETKVLVELLTVARSRCAQRGIPLEPIVPFLVTDQLEQANHTVLHCEGKFVLLATDANRRRRQNTIYSFSLLIPYLTPREVLWVLATQDKIRKKGAETVRLFTNSAEGIHALQLTKPTATEEHSDPFHRALALSPAPFDSSLAIEEAINIFSVDGPPIFEEGRLVAELDNHTAESIARLSPTELVAKARTVLPNEVIQNLASVEYGHIHLDRELDADQMTGILLGGDLVTRAREMGCVPAEAVLLVDDDHVLISLEPNEYRKFVREVLGDHHEFTIVPESSPIVRSIAVALYREVIQRLHSERVKRHGNNLYFQMSNGRVVELFEDIDGAAVTGCVLFEVALLIYRGNRSKFDNEFAEHSGHRSVNEEVLEILDADISHNEKALRVRDLHALLGTFTRVDVESNEFQVKVVDGLQAAKVARHCNVLEDYYSVQQERVRALIRELQLPIELITLHFRIETSTITLAS